MTRINARESDFASELSQRQLMARIAIAVHADNCDALNLVGKLITAEEIAYLVAFLASPKSIAVNGDAIAAGGGTRGSIFY